MESDEHTTPADAPMRPDEALALASSARLKVARRVSAPWWIDALNAVIFGAFMVGVVVVEAPQVAMVIVGWVLAFTGLQNYRRTLTGVVRDGSHRETFDPANLLVGFVAVAIFVPALLAYNTGFTWLAAGLVVLATVVAYVGMRWIDRRGVAAVSVPA